MANYLSRMIRFILLVFDLFAIYLIVSVKNYATYLDITGLHRLYILTHGRGALSFVWHDWSSGVAVFQSR